MRNKLLQFFRSQDGFSLVEAVLTIAIVGIAIIPISMVFSQTINTTVTTRKQLDANSMAQEYIEEVRAMSFDELNSIFTAAGASSLEWDHSNATEFGGTNLRTIDDGYVLRLSYGETTDLPAYQAPAVSTITDIDGIISLPSDDDPNFQIYEDDGTTLIADTTGSLPVLVNPDERVILIKLNRGSNNYTVVYRDGLAGSETEIITSGMTYDTSGSNTPRLQVNIGNIGTPGASGLTNYLVVESELIEEVKVFVFEESGNAINLQTQTLSGLVSFSRNLSTATDTHRILDIHVGILDETNNEVLASISTTKVEE